jgi:hypothetical protein
MQMLNGTTETIQLLAKPLFEDFNPVKASLSGLH